MNENSKNNSSQGSGAAGNSKKINEYKAKAVPKPKMGASDVLSVVYGKLSETTKIIEETADRAESAASRSERAAEKLREDAEYLAGQIPRTLEIKHVFSPEDKKHIEGMRTILAEASPAIKGAISRAAGDAANQIKAQGEKAGQRMESRIESVAKGLDYQFDSFKDWCKRWFWWFVGVSVCAVMCLFGMFYFGVKYYQADNRAERLQTERDSIWSRERIYQRFINDNPKTFDRWLENQR